MDMTNLCVRKVGNLEKIIEIKPDDVLPLILELSGGGYSEESTASAMEAGEQLRVNGHVTIRDWIMFRKGSDADPQKHARKANDLPKISDCDTDQPAPGQLYLIA